MSNNPTTNQSGGLTDQQILDWMFANAAEYDGIIFSPTTTQQMPPTNDTAASRQNSIAAQSVSAGQTGVPAGRAVSVASSSLRQASSATQNAGSGQNYLSNRFEANSGPTFNFYYNQRR